MKYLGNSYTKKIFTVYLKSKFHWVFCILSGNPQYGRKKGNEDGEREEIRRLTLQPQTPGPGRPTESPPGAGEPVQTLELVTRFLLPDYTRASSRSAKECCMLVFWKENHAGTTSR